MTGPSETHGFLFVIPPVGPAVPDSPIAYVDCSAVRACAARPATISGVGPLWAPRSALRARDSGRVRHQHAPVARPVRLGPPAEREAGRERVEREPAGVVRARAGHGEQRGGDEPAGGGFGDAHGLLALGEERCDLCGKRGESRRREGCCSDVCHGRRC